jgi:YHS domain-containing protein
LHQRGIKEGFLMANKKTETTHLDPVCGMEVKEGEVAGTSTYDGGTYYFCSTDCKDEFEENPEEYT